MNWYAFILSIVTFFSTLSGGLFASKHGNSGALAAFSAGVLIAVPLFDLLPETFNIAASLQVPFENVMHVTAIGFIFLYILERYFSVHRVCEGNICKNIRHSSGGLLGAGELSVHSFMDGLAIGVGFQFDVKAGIIIALAVISHDFSDGINTVTIMLNSGNSLKSSLRMLLVDALTPIAGVVSTLFIKIPEQYLVIFLPFFAGGFLYLGASDLLPQAHEKSPPLTSLVSSLAGFALIFILTRILNV